MSKWLGSLRDLVVKVTYLVIFLCAAAAVLLSSIDVENPGEWWARQWPIFLAMIITIVSYTIIIKVEKSSWLSIERAWGLDVIREQKALLVLTALRSVYASKETLQRQRKDGIISPQADRLLALVEEIELLAKDLVVPARSQGKPGTDEAGVE